MVIPLGGMGGQGGIGDSPMLPTPAVVKERWAKWWWALFTLFIAVCVGRLFALDVWGALLTGLNAFICWYIVSKDCANMSQYCLLLFGFMCVLNGVLEGITLAGNVGGRTEKNTSPRTQQNATATTYTVTIEKHPFFDPTGTLQYNTQSAMMIASPVVSLLGALLCWFTYGSYTTSLFSDQGEAGTGGFGSYGNSYGGAGNSGGGGYAAGNNGFSGASGNSGGRALGRPAPSGPRLFEGSGQRLGGN